MKTKRTNVVYFLAGLLLGGLVCVFPSCDDGIGNRASGEALSTTLSVSCLPFGSDSETAARGSGVRKRMSETVEIPLEGRWFLSATLEEEVEPPVRTDYDVMVDGAKFVVVAYKKSGMSYGDPQSANYVYDAGSGMLVKSGATTIELTSGATYKYVYYSYNSATATLPAYNASISVSPNPGATPNNDLLWGESGDIVAGDPVSVSLEHKFTRVKLKINTTETAAANLSISSALFATNCAGTLLVQDGEFSSSTNTTAQTFSLGAMAVSSTAYAESGYQLVYTGEQPSVMVRISGTIKNKSFNNLASTFAGPLATGQSYVLRVRLRKTPRWAASNIYWDPNLYPDEPEGQRGALTFKGYGASCDNYEQFYQGVFFRWGSLVGISPAYTFGGGTPIYVYHDGHWNATTTTAAVAAGYPGFTTSIPFSTVPWSYTEDHMGDTFSDNTGDICRFIGEHGGPSGYRMPKLAEFMAGVDVTIPFGTLVGLGYDWGTAGWSKATWSASFQETASTDPTGRQLYGGYPASNTGGYAANNGATFSAGGFRDQSGYARWPGTTGCYWSRTADYDGISAFDDHGAGYLHSFDKRNLFLFPQARVVNAAVRCLLDQ